VSQVTSNATNWSNDQPLSGTNCNAAYNASTVANPCVWANPTASKTVVLFGDSHADMWRDAIISIGQSRDWKVVSLLRRDCGASQAAATDWLGGSLQAGCMSWRNAALAYITKLKPYEVITSSALWHQAPTDNGHFVGDETALDKALLGAVAGHIATHVVVLADTMYAAYGTTAAPMTTAACLSRSSLVVTYDAQYTPTTPSSKPGACYRLYGDPQQGVTLTERAQVIAADRALKVTVIDPRPWLCQQTTLGICPPVLNNDVVYVDTTHLSGAFTRDLVPVLSPLIPN
jgi:hypothetical protein